MVGDEENGSEGAADNTENTDNSEQDSGQNTQGEGEQGTGESTPPAETPPQEQTAPQAEPAPATEPVKEEAPSPATTPTADESKEETKEPEPVAIGIVPDDVTKQPAAAPVEPTPPEEPVQSEPAGLTDASESDSPAVARLKEMLNNYKTLNQLPGTDAKHFVDSAKQASQIARFVINNPQSDVLELLLAFFVENKDGVCSDTEALKGSTMLDREAEQVTGFIWCLFADLANQRPTRIDGGKILTIIKKQEILHFYNRIRAGYMQGK